MASNASNVATAQRWWQSKRVPLYVVVGGTLGSALYFLSQKGASPKVETNKAGRKDPLNDINREQRSYGESAAGESGARQALKGAGMLGEGHQHTDGIFPNTKIAEKLGQLTGSSDSKGK